MHSQRTQISEEFHSPESSYGEDQERVQIGILEIGREEHKIFEGVTTIGSQLICDICLKDPECLQPKTHVRVEDGASLKFGHMEGKFSLLKSWKENLEILPRIQRLSLNDPNITQHPIESVKKVESIELKESSCESRMRRRKSHLSVDGDEAEEFQPKPKTSKQSSEKSHTSIYEIFGVNEEEIDALMTEEARELADRIIKANLKPEWWRLFQAEEKTIKKTSDSDDPAQL